MQEEEEGEQTVNQNSFSIPLPFLLDPNASALHLSSSAALNALPPSHSTRRGRGSAYFSSPLPHALISTSPPRRPGPPTTRLRTFSCSYGVCMAVVLKDHLGRPPLQDLRDFIKDLNAQHTAQLEQEQQAATHVEAEDGRHLATGVCVCVCLFF